MFYVYVIINKINYKLYVGQTNNLHGRWLKHISCSRSNYNHPLYNSIRKYGIDNFLMEQIEEFDNITDCNSSEEWWIKYLQTQNRNFGYNISFGGDNREILEETKQKLSLLNSGEGNPFYGKIHSDETKQKLSEFRTGTTVSENIKQKMSQSKIGEKNGMFGIKHTEQSKNKMSKSKIGKYNGESNPMYGKIHSEETKQKMSKINKGKKLSDETKQKISETLTGKMSGENNPMYGKIGEDNPNYGKSLSDETKKKISKALLGRTHTDETKKKMSEARKGKPSNRWKNRSKQETATSDIDEPSGIE